MRKNLDNIRLVLTFRLFAFALVGLGCLALFSDMDDSIRISLFIGTLVLLIIFWVIVKPGYFAFETANGQILISTDKEEKNEFYLRLPINELAGYEIEKSYAGFRRELFLYRKTKQGFLKSKSLPMSLFSARNTRLMCEQLDEMVSLNGFKHLKL